MSNEASETYKDMFDPGWREREKKQHDTFRALFTLQPVKNTFKSPVEVPAKKPAESN